jgi:deoxyribonuclease IV
MRLGAHTSIAGGISLAVGRAEADGSEALQVFTRNARGWTSPPLLPEEARAFRRGTRRLGLSAIAHGSYLVNLATEDSLLRARSISAVVEELRRCAALAIPCLVLHPGSHPDVQTGLRRVARALDDIHAETAGFAPRVCLEVTAGPGNCLGWRLEHLEEILLQASAPDRLGICLDTCHLFAAGYDISTARGMTAVLDEAIRRFGRRRLRAFHLNDSVGPLGCRRDRHAEFGCGQLGWAGLRALLRDARFRDTPAVLETPGPERYRAMLKTLRALGRPPRRPRRPRPKKPTISATWMVQARVLERVAVRAEAGPSAAKR